MWLRVVYFKTLDCDLNAVTIKYVYRKNLLRCLLNIFLNYSKYFFLEIYSKSVFEFKLNIQKNSKLRPIILNDYVVFVLCFCRNLKLSNYHCDHLKQNKNTFHILFIPNQNSCLISTYPLLIANCLVPGCLVYALGNIYDLDSFTLKH